MNFFICKQVLSGSGTQRWIYVSQSSRLQVAVVSKYTYGEYLVSVPIDGMGGWHVICTSQQEVEKIVRSECSRLGKLYNRLLRMPRFFLQGRLS